MEASWTIYWNEFTANAYMYGTSLKYVSKKHVEFSNSQMPPGTIIKEWYSKTNFQSMRFEPSLPLMDGESAYHITANIDFNQEEDSELMLRIVYYDRYDIEAESVILRGKENYFKPPLKVYNYKIQLVNAGVTDFVFHSLVLKEVSKEEFDGRESGNKKDKKNT